MVTLVGPSLSKGSTAVLVYGPKICMRKERVHSTACYRDRNWRTRLFREYLRALCLQQSNRKRKRERKKGIWRKRQNEKRFMWVKKRGLARWGSAATSLRLPYGPRVFSSPGRFVPPRVLSFLSHKKSCILSRSLCDG